MVDRVTVTAPPVTGCASVLAAATVRLREAFAGVLLPPRANGFTVAVVDGPPDSVSGLPAAWAELVAGRQGDTASAMVVATVRYVIVPASQPNDALSSSVCAIVDALEATRIAGRWAWSLQAITIGGVEHDAVVFDVPAQYPSTC